MNKLPQKKFDLKAFVFTLIISSILFLLIEFVIAFCISKIDRFEIYFLPIKFISIVIFSVLISVVSEKIMNMGMINTLISSSSVSFIAFCLSLLLKEEGIGLVMSLVQLILIIVLPLAFSFLMSQMMKTRRPKPKFKFR